jgi:HTH-type transcriptional regulator/antitoxin HigA
MQQSEYKMLVAEIEHHLQKGFSNLSKEELNQLEVWSNKVALFEQKNYSIPAPETLPEMIELKMYEMKLTQKELAERMGVSPAKFSLIINGKQEPDLAFLKQCKKVLGISAEFILDHA